MINYKFRCSSIGKLMTEAVSIDQKFRAPEVEAIIASKKRTDEEKAIIEKLKRQTLSETAKTYIRELAAEEIFGVKFEISSRPIEKGLLCEDAAIDMLNRVRGLDLIKNDERRSNDFITGECDLFDPARNAGHDIKCSWSLSTFPIVVKDCLDKDYEWQMRGYMALWNADRWEVNYCLIDTPEDLIGWEPPAMHFVSSIPEHHRVTSWVVDRCREKEALIWEKVATAREYFIEILNEFDATHREKGEA